MMRSGYKLPIFLVCFFLITGSTLAADKSTDPRQIFTEMMRAIETLNYQGTVAIMKNGKLDTMKYVHAVKQGAGQERLIALNSPLREIIRTSDKVMCMFQQSKDIVIDHRPVRRSFFMDLPAELEHVDANYNFVLGGEESIATLPTQVLLIHPKDKLRYHRKIWIDKHNHLPLRFELLDSAGIALEQAIFIDIEIKDSLPFVEISAEGEAKAKHIHELDKLPFSETQFIVDNLPSGFYKVFFTRRTMSSPDKLVEHLLLSDGFSTVSVYFERGDYAVLEPRLTKVGAINSYARWIEGNRLTVLGEVPMKTVQLIAKSVRLRSPH